MDQKNIVFSSATDLAENIRSGNLTSLEVVTAFFDQIDLYNGTFNPVVTLNRTQAIKRAREADAVLRKGETWGKLHGLPITIKDNFKTKGILTTSGYLPLKDHVPAGDAEIVKLLLAEGCIIIGKTNLSVLALDMQADNPVFGKTNNPWDITKTSGGSSGGCATALATGMTPLSFGNDLAGSIRLPASFCGVYGFRPTYGVVSLQGIQTDPKETVNGIRAMACAGPLARTIDDLELALTIIANPTNEFQRLVPVSRNFEVPGIKKMRIAWTDEFGGVPVDHEIKRKIKEYAARLETAGATVTKVIPDIDFYKVWKTWGSIVGMQGGYQTSNFSRRLGSFFTKGVLKDVPMHQNIVGPISVEKYMAAAAYQDEVITQIENFFNGYDAWICPVSATTAFNHHSPSKSYGNFSVYNDPLFVNEEKVHYYMATQAYTIPFSVTESPVLTLPIGMSDKRLPVGVQLVGRRYEDFKLLKLGKILNKYTDRIEYPLSRN